MAPDLQASPAKSEGIQSKIKQVSHGRAVLVLLIGTLFLSFTPIWVKATNMDPATQAFLRVALGFLILLPFGLREMKKKEGLAKKGIIYSVVAGIFLGVDFTAWNYSIFYIGAGVAAILLNLQVMADDSKAFRGDKPFVLTNLKTDEGLEEVISWIRHDVLMQDLVG